MADLVMVIVGITAGTALLFGSLITTIFCCKRHRRMRQTLNQSTKRQQQLQSDGDCLHSVIINQHIAKHLRQQPSISFITNNRHNDLTLIAPSHRFAMLEQQQQQQAATLVIENPLACPTSNLVIEEPLTFVYENPTLELGELTSTITPTSAVHF